jgi:integrase
LLLREGRFDQRNKNAAPGLSARTIGHCHRVLSRALGHAKKWGVIPTNPVTDVEPPRVESTEVEILREPEVKNLLEKLRGRMLYLVAVVGLATGMRRGELLALRRQDVDLSRGHIHIERSLEYTKGSGLRFKAPKTRRGRRTISIPPAIVAELRARFAQQQEQWLALGLGRVPDDALVFATEEGKTRSPNALSKDWSEMMQELGIKATLHSLRHTHASQLIAAGVDVVTISGRLGHASPVITLATYAHLFHNTGDEVAANVIEQSFAKLRDPKATA